MLSRRTLVLITLVLLALGGGWAIWNAGNQLVQTESVTRDGANGSPDVTAQNVSFVVTDGNVKKWKLMAKTAAYAEGRRKAKLTGVSGEFYDDDGKVILTFSAPKGDYTGEDDTVVLTGGVVAKSALENGGELSAPRMTWDAKSNQIVATGGIEMKTAQGRSTADSGRFALDFSDVLLEGGVTSVIEPP